MRKADVEYQFTKDGMEIYPRTAKAAAWIAKYCTTNVSAMIYYEREAGKSLIATMEHNGLKAVETGEGKPVKGKHSILYVADHAIEQAGPFSSKEKTVLWMQGHGKAEFELVTQFAYYLSPEHGLIPIEDDEELMAAYYPSARQPRGTRCR